MSLKLQLIIFIEKKLKKMKFKIFIAISSCILLTTIIFNSIYLNDS